MGRGEIGGQGRDLWGGVMWKERMEEGEAGMGSIGSGQTEESQKGAMRPTLTIANLNIAEGCFGT